MKKRLRILGIRGIPAAHGGFETFAEHLALYLVSHGWEVIVYCQEFGLGEVYDDSWQGVKRVIIPVKSKGPGGTVLFDWKAKLHATQFKDLCLTLGYNTAIFCALLRLKGVPNIINMDGMEWKRQKWGRVAKLWFWLNDWAGCWLGKHLVADHPQIKMHLQTRVCGDKITMIPYGADLVISADDSSVRALGLVPGQFMTVIARAEPENSILEIVKGFSNKPRGYQLVVLGNYKPDNAYHNEIKQAASDEVKFVGAIYDKSIVQALRFHSVAYVHGHQVGGTNPSLVEAMGAGNAVIANDNPFNRWVAGDSARYFNGADELSALLDDLLKKPSLLDEMRAGTLLRYRNNFTWETVLADYENLLNQWHAHNNSRVKYSV